MVVRVSNIGAVLAVQSHLEEVRQGTAIAIGATRAGSTNGSRMDDVVAGSVLSECWGPRIAIKAFRRVNIPLCPAICCSTRTWRLHCRNIVGVTSDARSQPGHYQVNILIWRRPTKSVCIT